MSDTPRTNAELKRVADQLDGGEDNAAYVLSQLGAHACMLEREVERLRAELDRLKEAIPAVLTHIDDIGARGYYSGKTLEEDAAIEVLRAALKETK